MYTGYTPLPCTPPPFHSLLFPRPGLVVVKVPKGRGVTAHSSKELARMVLDVLDQDKSGR